MRSFIGISQITGHLVNLYILRIGRKRKGNNSFITKLFFHFGKINTSSIHPGRCSCFKPSHLYTHLFQRSCQMSRCHQTIRSCMSNCFTTKTSCIQVSSCTEYHCPAFINGTGKGFHTDNLLRGIVIRICIFFPEKLADFCLFDSKMILILQNLSHSSAVFCFICLGTKRMNSRTFGNIQHL